MTKEDKGKIYELWSRFGNLTTILNRYDITEAEAMEIIEEVKPKEEDKPVVRHRYDNRGEEIDWDYEQKVLQQPKMNYVRAPEFEPIKKLEGENWTLRTILEHEDKMESLADKSKENLLDFILFLEQTMEKKMAFVEKKTIMAGMPQLMLIVQEGGVEILIHFLKRYNVLTTNNGFHFVESVLEIQEKERLEKEELRKLKRQQENELQ